MKRREGYSLLEVIIALAIFSIAIFPILSVYPSIFKMSEKADQNEEVSRLAFTMIDYVKSRGYNNLKIIVDNNGGTYSGKYVFKKDSLESTAYIIDTSVSGYQNFESDFNLTTTASGIDHLFILSSKSVDLSKTVIYLRLDKKGVGLEGGNKYYNPLTDKEEDTYPGYDEYIYGSVIIGTGDANSNNITGKEKEYFLTFVVSPIENWGN
ncbi:prepilin-type N-terminal cleavage/methylation domain-containing protein [Hypnocyclicus thermotrophus]|uniref:Prepilin-type N-terminal cleavage/methylation domain-containing protein n=1 Tax=Hypnocyclicus thermotrophus TaxID=1627895 RepID=A0AA46I5C2_9FUSO|nr:type II secretion system protein [Hypnocyclicus thermotrophus]TDT69793.1 prepilin-type N-terminal cleavage/methylation domain-containing protein [Hypnocyclicus thermotrophus]